MKTPLQKARDKIKQIHLYQYKDENKFKQAILIAVVSEFSYYIDKCNELHDIIDTLVEQKEKS